MAGLEATLLQHPFFKGLEADMGSLVSGCARNVRLEAGAYLFHEGQSANEFYLIRQGEVALEIAGPGRAPAVLLTLGEGELVGVSWLVPPYRWTLDARAVKPMRALGIDARCLRAKCEADNRLGYELLKRCLAMLVNRLHTARLQTLDLYGTPTP